MIFNAAGKVQQYRWLLTVSAAPPGFQRTVTPTRLKTRRPALKVLGERGSPRLGLLSCRLAKRMMPASAKTRPGSRILTMPLTYRDRGTSGTQLDVLCGDIASCTKILAYCTGATLAIGAWEHHAPQYPNRQLNRDVGKMDHARQQV
jgi:hypothetical protein